MRLPKDEGKLDTPRLVSRPVTALWLATGEQAQKPANPLSSVTTLQSQEIAIHHVGPISWLLKVKVDSLPWKLPANAPEIGWNKKGKVVAQPPYFWGVSSRLNAIHKGFAKFHYTDLFFTKAICQKKTCRFASENPTLKGRMQPNKWILCL